MIGTSAAMVTTTLANYTPGGNAGVKLAYAAAIVAATVYAVGVIACSRLPEPASEHLPE
jgi:hypothetical protein